MPLTRQEDSDVAKLYWVYAIMGWGSGGSAGGDVDLLWQNEDGSQFNWEDNSNAEWEAI